jgi:hypothetical protein
MTKPGLGIEINEDTCAMAAEATTGTIPSGAIESGRVPECSLSGAKNRTITDDDRSLRRGNAT